MMGHNRRTMMMVMTNDNVKNVSAKFRISIL